MRYRCFAGIAILAICLPPLAMASPIDVYVGYADNLRPTPFFPVPWQGDPAVALFAGSGPDFDAGAVMISNTGTTAVTIDSISVTVPTWSENPFGGPTATSSTTWAGFLPFTLSGGKAAIFTQTAPGPAYNFDTSDFGAPGLNGTSNCDPGNAFALANAAFCASIAPTVTVSVGGIPSTFTDSAHVLDTGGFDFATAVGNESLQWRLIGTTGINNPGGTPEPGTLFLFGGGLLGLGALGSKRRRGST